METEEQPIKAQSSIPIILNKEVLEILKGNRLNINQLFILLALYEDTPDLLDIYDNFLSDERVLVQDYQFLNIHGLIERTLDDEPLLYQLTSEGKTMVEQARLLFDLPEDEKRLEATIKQLASDYLQIWPNKLKLPSGVYARVSIVEIEKKLRSFFKAYRMALKKEYGIKLTSEDILQATREYVARYAKKNFMYAQNSSYFIQKKEKSSLADEIIALKQGVEKQVNKWEKQV